MTPGHPHEPTGRERADALSNSLHLGQRDLDHYLDGLDAASEVSKPGGRRDFIRWPFRRVGVRVHLRQPGGSVTEVVLACRNLSRGGMALLHSAYIYPGTRVTVDLPHPTLGTIPTEGSVARCIHRSGVVHEIGVRFDGHVNLKELIRPEPLSACATLERVDPTALAGRLVCLEELPVDLSILRGLLRETSLRVRTTCALSEAAAWIADGADLVLCGDSLAEGANAADFVQDLRARGILTPVIVLSAGVGTADRDRLSAAGANALLSKPLDKVSLFRVLAEFLLVPAGRNGAADDTAPSNVEATLSSEFVSALKHWYRQLSDGMSKMNGSECRAVCVRIAGTAPSAGQSALAGVANEALGALSRSMSVQESLPALRALVAMCAMIIERAAAA